jgi:glycosyltransferase involved in cell wall biosynthesis
MVVVALRAEVDRQSGVSPVNGAEAIEVSVVMPCLNEAETLEACIVKAQRALQQAHIAGEIVIADNGSSDGSLQIAERLGAKVVNVQAKGYGSALMGGIAAASGQYVVMGDADDSYDFGHIPRFVEQLRKGADVVMGNRFRGGIQKNAMPPLHRYFGNPALTRLGRLFFKSPVGDFYCGLRGFRKDAYERMALRTTGMEFATEMVVKATLLELRIAEVPTTLSPDGPLAVADSTHLGWNHLRCSHPGICCCFRAAGISGSRLCMLYENLCDFRRLAPSRCRVG